MIILSQIHYFCFVALMSFNFSLAIEFYESENATQLPVLPPIKVGQKTYYVETFFKANWYRAIQFCRFNGMDLASINNEEENSALIGALESAYGAKLVFWTSGNDLAQTQSFFWKSTGADFGFTYWWPGEPDNAQQGDEIEHCVELVGPTEGNKLQWNDVKCSAERYIICEKIARLN